MTGIDPIFGAFERNDPQAPIQFTYRIKCGEYVCTVSGTLPRNKLEMILRDPSNLNTVVSDLPAGSAVTVLLPPGTLASMSIGAPL